MLINVYYIFILKKIFIYLFLSALGLCYCAQAFSSCGEQGTLLVAVLRFLNPVASPAAEHGLEAQRLSSCGSWAQLLRGT